MINVVQQTLETGDEAGARQLFDVFETLLILVGSRYLLTVRRSWYMVPKEIPLLGPHIKSLAAFLLQSGGNRNFDADLRVLALNALNWTIQ